MKTPEEIKKGLECCAPLWNGESLERRCDECPYKREGFWCNSVMLSDAHKRFEQLESRLSQVERERDAAIYDMTQIVHEVDDIACIWCKNAYSKEAKCKECRIHNEGFEWQGVQPTNTKGDSK